MTSTLLNPDISIVYGLGSYHDNRVLQKLIHTAKYYGIQSAMQPLSLALSEALSNSVTLNYDAIIPVPLHHQRQRERGFNQSKLLVAQLPKPILPGLQRVHSTTPQAKLNRTERLVNLQHAFTINPAVISQLANKRILLVDDVMTTGSTLLACAKILRQAGVSEIIAAVAAIDQ